MPYTPLSTLSNGVVLSASHLNAISNNIEYLHGIANRVNTGFNTFRTTTSDLTNAHAVWYIRHKHKYLHYRIVCSGTPNHVRLFFNGTMYVTSTSTTVSGYVDLTNLAVLPGLVGAWSSGTGYDFNSNGDSDIVSNGGSYYRCLQDHTSSSSDEPGVGANWEAFWVRVSAPTVNTWCNMWVTAGFNSSTLVTVEYLLQSPSTSI